MTYLEEYHDLIKHKEIVVGYYLKKEIKNLINDLQNPKYLYDTTEAHKRIKFMETLCLQSKAPYYMKPLELMPWQKAWWEAVYSFKMEESKHRRFIDGLLEIARKNGKSTMFAGDGNYDLFLGDGGTDICCASNDDRQARLIWREIGGMRSRLDPKKRITSQNLTEIRNTKKNINVFRLSSKTQNKDGFNITKTYLDESHDIAEENGQSEVAEACWRGMSSQDEPLFLNCTTQGFNRECYLDNKINYAKRVIDGEIDDDRFIAFLFEQDSEQEIWQDETSWEKSNPSIRYGVKKIDKLRRDIETAKFDKATRIHLLTKDFNIPQSSAQSWLMLEDYDYPQEHFDLEDFRGSWILGAVDLSATTDLSSSKALIMKPNDKTKYIISHYFIPESKLTASDDKEAGANYKEWAKQGLLTICEGNEVDISQVADWYFMLLKNYGIKPYKIGYDQRYARAFIDRCEEYNFDTEMLQQGRALSNAMKFVEAELKSKNINYRNNEIDRWNLSNCCCEVDNVGNIQPVKSRTQKSKRIDGAVTLIMAFEMYRRYRSDYQTLINK
ncbi:MAG: terminase large subunit [Methanobrevibacter sp.]|nr:terminase large subunit [Methanobrevibacter sp.]